MALKELLFFATILDLEPHFKALEDHYELQYFETGLFDSEIPIQYESIFDTPSIGYASSGDWIRDKKLLIVPKTNNLSIRSILQKKGDVKYAIAPSANPISVYLQLGGIWDSNSLIAGKFGCETNYDFTSDIYKFVSSFLKKFPKISRFYVGDDAYEKLQKGWRLTTNVKSPLVYDLKL